ncbi:hypothetical protein NL676_035653 [Syzygium grande]|nr:hypothetical protein NL676_035653 [Syzygium grande]
MKPGSTQWVSLQNEVVKALEEYGCFEARYDRISVELYDDVFKQLEDLFDLPAEMKRRFVDLRKPYDGYLANPTSFASIRGDGNLRRAGLRRHSEDGVSELRRGEIPGFACQVLEPLDPGHEIQSADDWGALDRGSSHCDKNFLTILQQNHVNGLEVQTKDGKWIQVAPSACTFIVMVGESFLGWSNGRLHCPTHRVMMSGTETRYSIGSFSAIRGVIKCPSELVDEQHPLLFKPFDEIDLLRFHQTEQGLKAELTLKA